MLFNRFGIKWTGYRVSDNAKMDDELAAFTDNLLAGRNTPVSEEMEALSKVVRQLHTMIAPEDQPSPAFRTHLTQRLTREWNLFHQRQHQIVPFYRRRSVITLAASLLVVLLAVVLLSQRDSNEPLQGTALGSLRWDVIIVVGALITAGLVALWFNQRTKR